MYLVHSLTYFSTSPFDRKGAVSKTEVFSNAFITVLPKKNTYFINTGVNNCYFVFIIASNIRHTYMYANKCVLTMYKQSYDHFKDLIRRTHLNLNK